MKAISDDGIVVVVFVIIHNIACYAARDFTACMSCDAIAIAIAVATNQHNTTFLPLSLDCDVNGERRGGGAREEKEEIKARPILRGNFEIEILCTKRKFK